jgi:hypothetical protein
MATYELYEGGPRQQNTDWAIFPAAPFLVANTANLALPSKTPVVYGASRTLDFANDKALAYFYRKNWVTPVNADILGSVVIPANSLLLGCWYKVNAAMAGASGTFKLRRRQAAVDLTGAISMHAVASAFVAVSGGAVVVPSTVSIAALFQQLFAYSATSDIIDVVVVQVPTPNVMSTFTVTLTPVYFNLQSGMMN